MAPDTLQNASWWDAVTEAAELLREGQNEAAVGELRATLDREPANAYAYYFLGAAYFERGDFELARGAYEQAVTHAPGYLGAVVGLGHALRMLGRMDDAVRVGERAIAMSGLEAGDPDTHYLLGLV